jgi:CspA family cold shock protein
MPRPSAASCGWLKWRDQRAKEGARSAQPTALRFRVHPCQPDRASTSLDSTPGQQHNAYTIFVAPGNHALFRVDSQKRGVRVERLKGTVKWFNNAKGYGFLGRDDGPDVFIHYSSITTEGYKSLQEGDKVEFEIVQGQKGPQAANVTKVS